jgi:hypothetical protein
MHFLADRVVLGAEAHELGELRFERLGLVAQSEDLPLGQRDRAPAVRVRHVDRLEQLGMLVEELRVRAQVLCDVVRAHSSISITPW